jgi:hypothetical protein
MQAPEPQRPLRSLSALCVKQFGRHKALASRRSRDAPNERTVDLRVKAENPGKLRQLAEETGVGFVITFAGEQLVVWDRQTPDVRDRKLDLEAAVSFVA